MMTHPELRPPLELAQSSQSLDTARHPFNSMTEAGTDLLISDNDDISAEKR